MAAYYPKEDKDKNIDQEEVADLIITLRDLHPHTVMMTQFEVDLVNNLIQKFRLHGEKMKVTEKQFDRLLDIAEKLYILKP
ncbi:MAG: hypothetical protein PVG39_00505 [Desulfobacteraceae bacterium]|jgi:hypothetical protein